MSIMFIPSSFIAFHADWQDVGLNLFLNQSSCRFLSLLDSSCTTTVGDCALTFQAETANSGISLSIPQQDYWQ